MGFRSLQIAEKKDYIKCRGAVWNLFMKAKA